MMVLPGLQQSVQLNGAEWCCENFGGQGEPLILRGRYQVKSCVHRTNSCKSERSIWSFPEQQKYAVWTCFLTLPVFSEDAGCDAADVFFTDTVVTHLKVQRKDTGCYQIMKLEHRDVARILITPERHRETHPKPTCGRRPGTLKRWRSPRLVRQTSVCSL